jgi:hypothetical protein
MRVCVTLSDHKIHCFEVPELVIPFPPHGPIPPDPGPEAFLRDLMILTTINQATAQIADPVARHALQSGFSAGVKGLQAKIGKDITIEAPRHG